MGIFNNAIFNNLVFNTTKNVSPVDTHDGVDADTYKKYRKRLEKLSKAYEKHNQSKYVQEIVEVIKESNVSINTPTLDVISKQIENNETQYIDLSSLQDEINRVINYINALILQLEKTRQEEDDMIVLLMLA